MKTQDLGKVRLALKAGADADEQDVAFGVSPLAMAALNGNVNLAEVLLDHGAHVDVRNRDGSTPLSGAAFLGRSDMLEFLLREGADPDAKNAAGGTVLEATAAPWDLTEYMADLLGVEIDREKVESGRRDCIELLRG